MNNPDAVLNLVYIDDVCKSFIDCLKGNIDSNSATVSPVYHTSVGEVVSIIRSFKDKQHGLLIDHVGTGLTRALYATYLSYYSPSDFAYSVKRHSDPRGTFVEMLKTKESGQFSFLQHILASRGVGTIIIRKMRNFLSLKVKRNLHLDI